MGGESHESMRRGVHPKVPRFRRMRVRCDQSRLTKRELSRVPHPPTQGRPEIVVELSYIRRRTRISACKVPSALRIWCGPARDMARQTTCMSSYAAFLPSTFTGLSISSPDVSVNNDTFRKLSQDYGLQDSCTISC